jgi:hypothetical protein
MPDPYEIPLSGAPQQFSMQVAGTTYQFVFLYRDAPAAIAGGSGWVLDIGDSTGAPIVCGIPLVTGADLLAQYAYLNFSAQIWVRSDGIPDAVPTFDNLGTDSHVYLVTLP